MAYGGNPSTDVSDQIRLYVGDISTSTSAEILTDDDYDHFSSVASNVFTAAQLAANSIAAKFAGVATDVAEKKVGDLVIKRSDAMSAANGYRSLARQLGRMAATQISPYAGGQSIDGKLDVERDSDRVPPMFKRNLMSNPAVQAFTGRATST